jgi:hypothetical protein
VCGWCNNAVGGWCNNAVGEEEEEVKYPAVGAKIFVNHGSSVGVAGLIAWKLAEVVKVRRPAGGFGAPDIYIRMVVAGMGMRNRGSDGVGGSGSGASTSSSSDSSSVGRTFFFNITKENHLQKWKYQHESEGEVDL